MAAIEHPGCLIAPFFFKLNHFIMTTEQIEKFLGGNKEGYRRTG